MSTRDVELQYEIIGDGYPLLMIQGLGAQMVLWDDDLCGQLVEAGFQVIRFDNRDVGASSRFPGGKVGRVHTSILKAYLGLPVRAPYTLEDMADDAIGLLDHLGVDKAAVLGVSMGGMIAQLVAIRHPTRVSALISMLSSAGSKLWPQPRALHGLLRAPPRDRDGYAEHMVRYFRTVGGSLYSIDEERLRSLAAMSFDRGVSPAGSARQLLAICASSDRRAELRRLDLPALVVHGSEDPLIPLAGGVATARAIPHAHLEVIHGMGHFLPRGSWSRFIPVLRRVALG